MNNLYIKTLDHLKTKQKILFLTTSNRWSGEEGGEKPKSTLLAEKFAKDLGEKVKIIDVTKLKIYSCEGNVSTEKGNSCGQKEANLKDNEKNPSACHRCWASLNNKDDELWQISKSLFESDCVIFFGSVRWGQMNSFYQKLIERLTWLENRHSTLGEDNLLGKIDAGIIAVGHNWHGKEVIETQKQVLKFYGFNVVDDICWNWQFTEDENSEDNESYLKASKVFMEEFID
ncbi:MAG: NAD(P)H-dependent oxidoreductase [Candidatus Gracilibacteria bacterium]